MVGGVFFLSVMDASAKWLTDRLSVVRAHVPGAHCPRPSSPSPGHGEWRAGHVEDGRNGRGICSRCIVGVATMVTFFYALKLLPLADTVAISFVAPLFMCALSVPLLGEKVGPRRWAAISVGFAGVIVIVQPSGAGFGLGADSRARGRVHLCAVSINLSRQISTRETSYSMLFWFSVFLLMRARGGGALRLGHAARQRYRWSSASWPSRHAGAIPADPGLPLWRDLVPGTAGIQRAHLGLLFGFIFWQEFPSAVVLRARRSSSPATSISCIARR